MENDQNQNHFERIKSDPVLSAKYQMIQTIGQGCFGKIIKVKQKKSNEIRALKIQKFQNSQIQLTIKNQIDILKKLEGKYGVPIIYNYGKCKYGMFIQMQLFEQDLNRTTKYGDSKIMALTFEMLKILNDIHDCNILHRDLKPHNIMKDANGSYYLIDFGLSREIPLAYKHEYMNGFIGTPRYASVRAHCHLEQSKKDDLESLFYVIAYLYYRKLPWLKLNIIPNDKKMEQIKILKIRFRESLFKEMPKVFSQAFNYIIKLQHKQQPNYKFLKNLFKRQSSTLIMLPSNNETVNRNKKKMSLNLSNFLQVPQPNFCSKNDFDKISRSNSSITLLSGESFSNRVMITLQDSMLQNDDKENMQQLCSEPNLPDISKFMQNVTIKNPFG